MICKKFVIFHCDCLVSSGLIKAVIFFQSFSWYCLWYQIWQFQSTSLYRKQSKFQENFESYPIWDLKQDCRIDFIRKRTQAHFIVSFSLQMSLPIRDSFSDLSVKYQITTATMNILYVLCMGVWVNCNVACPSVHVVVLLLWILHRLDMSLFKDTRDVRN